MRAYPCRNLCPLLPGLKGMVAFFTDEGLVEEEKLYA
jgi:hypothetical protein